MPETQRVLVVESKIQHELDYELVFKEYTFLLGR